MNTRRVALAGAVLLALVALLVVARRAPPVAPEAALGVSPGAPRTASGEAAPARTDPVVATPTGEPPPEPPPPATAESVAAAFTRHPEMVQTCFAALDRADVARVSVVGRIGSLAQHAEGPRGYVDELDVELPDGTLAPPAAVHCFSAAANFRVFETPRQGPVPFEVDVPRPADR